ncbi:hypothetical protein CEP53_011558 [Fusarium sp. AF-6]|nr:hypothetical protein CEP53_011558 [Fusarium sp. AF-6]
MSSFQVPVFDTFLFPLPVRAFIGGEFVDSTSDEKHTLISSVNDQVLTKDLQWANARDVDLAVESSRKGLALWQAMSNDARRDALVKYGNLIRQNREQLHWLEAILTGKDSGFCGFEIDAAVDLFIYYGNMIDKFESEVMAADEDSIRYTLRQPWGICAGICPFNGVIVTLAMKAAPALACGNSIIVKTSEMNPFSTLFMTSLARDALFLPGYTFMSGDPTAPSTYSSPLYHHRQKDVVLSYIESGKAEAKLITGGNAVGENGCYVEPTIFVDPAPNARVLREEIFGPVLVVIRFSTDDDVLRLANDTEFGLAASVWTADMKRALRFAHKLEAGSVSVNGAGGYHPSVPMGGWKQSGQGLENGKEAMLDWTQLKSVALRG